MRVLRRPFGCARWASALLIGSVALGIARAQTPKPDLTPVPASANAAKEINAFLDADRKRMPPEGAVLFMGSSTFTLWKTLAQDLPEIPVINRGFGGSLIQDSTQYADRIAIPYRPKMIVMFAGTNDLAYGNKKPPQVLDEYEAFVAKIHAALPDTRIVYISINPTVARWKQEADVLEANHLIEEFILKNRSATEKLNYIDSHSQLLSADGLPQPALEREDGLHLNAEGYRVFTSIIKPRILALAAMEGVTRPSSWSPQKRSGTFSAREAWTRRSCSLPSSRIAGIHIRTTAFQSVLAEETVRPTTRTARTRPRRSARAWKESYERSSSRRQFSSLLFTAESSEH